ncbi:type II toxin-antitoxin system Phd/YefM family antitoxin [Duganella callida]|uniref:Type II toxin-antitoxin system Phd/YefM family antitoxin n=1 Tax=Duganella callida TaxID=2561932 RepID=A0A4Y9SMA8_9BURK|nr:type II toxin-antitoxin system Phd/YefM family antitoxin [Duganella callida]TFW23418.1 type II toxin-antitoxin system Phd/YefM family antitoxin [Duganella callida]
MWPTISLDEFLANPLAAIREIAASQQIFLITENGKPILDVRPYRSGPDEKLRGSVIWSGDIVSPVEDPFK